MATNHETQGTAVLDRPTDGTEQNNSDQQAERQERRHGRPTGPPAGERSLEEIRQEAQEIRNANRKERIDLFREKLKAKQTRLAEISARMSGHIFSRKKGNARALYEAHLASYNETLQEIGRLEHPELHEEPSTLDESERNKIAVGFLFKEQAKLREETQKNLEGTKLAKVVNWMNDGGRLKVAAKYLGVGILFGGIAALTGGAAAGVGVAAGISATGRFSRGFIRSEADRGTDIDSVEDATGGEEAFAKEIDDNRGHKETLIEAGSRILGQMFREKDVREKQKGRFRSIRNGLFMTALGYGISKVVGAGMAMARADGPTAGRSATPGSPAHGQLANQEGMEGSNSEPPSAADYNKADRQSMVDYNKWIEPYVYHHEQNPYYFFHDKIGKNDFGPPLNPNATIDDLTKNRWLDSPEQFASICAAFGIDGLPDDTATINGLAEQFKLADTGPQTYMNKYEAVMKIMNAEGTTVETGVPIESSRISSELLTDPNNTGNPERAWQDLVQNQDKGTKTVITFQDPNTQEWRTIELREQCGGQRMCELPEPVYVPEVSSYAPQGGGYVENYSQPQPQGGGSPEYTQPNPDQPQGGGEPNPPTTGNPPTVTPPTVLPPPVTTPENKGPSLTDMFTGILGSGEQRPPAVVAPQEQTYPGGRDTGGGNKAPAIVDNSADKPGTQIGTGAANADRGGGISPSGESGGRSANPGVGNSSSVDTGAPK